MESQGPAWSIYSVAISEGERVSAEAQKKAQVHRLG